ncbi:MAG: hypothetical protein WC869_14885, partial [Phycisphaerae bacterium]
MARTAKQANPVDLSMQPDATSTAAPQSIATGVTTRLHIGWDRSNQPARQATIASVTTVWPNPHISHWVLRAYIEGRGVWADGFVVVARQIGADYPLTPTGG